MPIYEYRCEQCEHEFDRLQKVDADAPECPECGAPETARKVSRTSFRLKGSGWYATDYADAGGDGPSTETSASEDTGSSGESDTGGSSTEVAATSTDAGAAGSEGGGDGASDSASAS